MKQETVNKIIKHLNNIISTGVSIQQYLIINNLSNQYFSSKVAEAKASYKKGSLSEENYNTIMELYEMAKLRRSETEESRAGKTDVIRDENGRIAKYTFEIYIRDKAPLIGCFSRDEMSLIYRLYSSYGSNITQREVSRFFPEYSLIDFKRILRIFNITKASAPFPQHVLEENSKEQLLDMQFREKENDFLRSYEVEKVRNLNNQLNKYLKENADLKAQLKEFNGMLDNIDVNTIHPVISELKPETERDLFIWISDMHIGASVANTSIYKNDYNAKEVRDRLQRVFDAVASKKGYDNIIVCNLGDSLDGYNGGTTRGGHVLPQNMNNKEQVKCFIEEMTLFFKNLQLIPHNKIKYYAVGESNHGGDFEYTAQVGLSYILNAMGVESTVYDTFIGHFEHRGHFYVLSHGKDGINMYKNWPLVLNDKVEGYINQYLDENHIYTATIIKGDLHQSATSYGKRIKYKSVGSLFGSSEWIHVNFGNTRACCDFSILENDNMYDSRVVLN